MTTLNEFLAVALAAAFAGVSALALGLEAWRSRHVLLDAVGWAVARLLGAVPGGVEVADAADVARAIPTTFWMGGGHDGGDFAAVSQLSECSDCGDAIRQGDKWWAGGGKSGVRCDKCGRALYEEMMRDATRGVARAGILDRMRARAESSVGTLPKRGLVVCDTCGASLTVADKVWAVIGGGRECDSCHRVQYGDDAGSVAGDEADADEAAAVAAADAVPASDADKRCQSCGQTFGVEKSAAIAVAVMAEKLADATAALETSQAQTEAGIARLAESMAETRDNIRRAARAAHAWGFPVDESLLGDDDDDEDAWDAEEEEDEELESAVKAIVTAVATGAASADDFVVDEDEDEDEDEDDEDADVDEGRAMACADGFEEWLSQHVIVATIGGDGKMRAGSEEDRRAVLGAGAVAGRDDSAAPGDWDADDESDETCDCGDMRGCKSIAAHVAGDEERAIALESRCWVARMDDDDDDEVVKVADSDADDDAPRVVAMGPRVKPDIQVLAKVEESIHYGFDLLADYGWCRGYSMDAEGRYPLGHAMSRAVAMSRAEAVKRQGAADYEDRIAFLNACDSVVSAYLANAIVDSGWNKSGAVFDYNIVGEFADDRETTAGMVESAIKLALARVRHALGLAEVRRDRGRGVISGAQSDDDESEQLADEVWTSLIQLARDSGQLDSGDSASVSEFRNAIESVGHFEDVFGDEGVADLRLRMRRLASSRVVPGHGRAAAVAVGFLLQMCGRYWRARHHNEGRLIGFCDVCGCAVMSKHQRIESKLGDVAHASLDMCGQFPAFPIEALA